MTLDPHDLPLTDYDEGIIAAILSAEASDDAKDGMLRMINLARDFASDDPAVWSRARAVNARLDALAGQRDRGAIGAAALTEELRRALADCDHDCWLACLHLRRCHGLAFAHLLRRALPPN